VGLIVFAIVVGMVEPVFEHGYPLELAVEYIDATVKEVCDVEVSSSEAVG